MVRTITEASVNATRRIVIAGEMLELGLRRLHCIAKPDARLVAPA